MMQDALTQLTRNTEHIYSEKELADKLASGRSLRVKLGVDPTAPDLHLGHAVQLRKLRQFQDLGHHVILIIGNFTAMIGDPSGRTVTRPPLTQEEVMANAKTFTDQAFLVLDREKTEVVYNGDWLSGMTFSEVIRLNARVTMQQMLQREDFKKRLALNEEVRLHELQYPIVQGWDSVVIRADVEIGGTDQLFNMLVGRDLQKGEGLEPQIVMTLPLLEGLDGNKKMSKSLGNYVGLTEAPQEMFGKLMSISDEIMPKYYRLAWGRDYDPSMHPMEAKKQLAAGVVEIYHSAEAAAAARKQFEDQFGKGDVAKADLPEVDRPEAGMDVMTYVGRIFRQVFEQERSNADIRRLIAQGSVRINGEKITEPKAVPALMRGDVVKLDKKRMVRVK